jgi:hypothetical protein
MKIIKFKKSLLLSFLAAILLTACVSEEPLPLADRQFRPIVKKSTISLTWLQFEWDRYVGSKTYEIEMSTDTFKTVYRYLRTDSTKATVTNLDFDTKYQIRLRSVGDSIVASGDTIRSNYYVFELTTLDYPTYLKTPASTDMVDKSIRVTWNLSTFTYTHFDIMVSKDSVYKRVSISPAENASGEKIITGLQPSNTYYVKIFDASGYKGKKIFKTLAAQVFEGDVVDLRDLSDDVALNKITQLYIDSLGGVYPNGFNLILSGGTKYKLPTILVPVSMNIVTGLSLKGNAILAVNGGLGIKAGVTVPKINVEKISFTEGTDAGKLKTDANYGGTYLFNFNQANGNATSIVVENCNIRYKRGVCRMQTTASLGSISINNCFVDSIGGYGIVNVDNAGSNVLDVKLTNSTFAHFDGYLYRNTKSTPALPNSLLIDKITTCYSPASTRYLIEAPDRVFAGGVTISNSIFGSVLTAATTVNGLKVGAGTNVTVDNCFKTSDLVWTPVVGGTDPAFPIACTDLGKTSAEIFASPTTSNFKVTNTLLVRKAGDPRWW